jgi:hypothetical protein
MTFKRLFGIAVVVFALAALVGSVGAGAANTPAKPAVDLSTNTGVTEYLRSLGISPSGVVIQRGARNYAGPHCPGKDWTCTTSSRVVQIATGHGENTFRCSVASCVVVQATESALATNTARCIRTTGITQSCSINQSSTSSDNQAIIVEIANKTSGLTQNASQTAQIVQTADSGANTACVLQRTTIEGSTVARRGTPVTVTLDAHQSISITQDSHSGGNAIQSATSSGACLARPLDQSQTLTSTATGSASITQRQNAATNGPNMVLNIEQNQKPGFIGSASGPNTAAFSQSNTLTAFATTPAGPVTQVQSSPDGGIEASVDQFSTTPSTIDAHQDETQCERAATSGSLSCNTPNPALPAGWSQTQFGPMRKGPCCSTQLGSDGHRFTIDQVSTQTAGEGGNVRQSNVVEGECTTSGTAGCTVDQTTTVQGETTHNRQIAQTVSTSITCSGSSCTTSTIAFDGSPGTSAPPPTLGPYTMTPFGPDSQPVCPDEGAIVTGVTDPAGTIGFTPALQHDRATGPCWQTWSHGYTGDVYDSLDAVDPTRVTITLPAGTRAFYFYAEPNVFDVFDVQATAQDGTTSGPIQVQGFAGAQYFGFYSTGTLNLASITVTTTDTTGFAVGEFGIATAAPPPIG